MTLKAIGNFFIFQFLNETANGKFISRTKSNIILTEQDLTDQASAPRWGKVLSVGNNVKDIKVNDLVLIEALQWSPKMMWNSQFYWRSTDEKVIAIANDESVTYER